MQRFLFGESSPQEFSNYLRDPNTLNEMLGAMIGGPGLNALNRFAAPQIKQGFNQLLNNPSIESQWQRTLFPQFEHNAGSGLTRTSAANQIPRKSIFDEYLNIPHEALDAIREHNEFARSFNEFEKSLTPFERGSVKPEVILEKTAPRNERIFIDPNKFKHLEEERIKEPFHGNWVTPSKGAHYINQWFNQLERDFPIWKIKEALTHPQKADQAILNTLNRIKKIDDQLSLF